jgi:hypothetical protein
MSADYLVGYEPVRNLIEEVRRQRNTVNAAITWQNAFMLFKKAEERIGLPDDNNRDGYLAIVCDLRAAGYCLLMAVKAQGIDLEKKAEITPSAFRSCLKELEFDEFAELFGQDEAAMEKIKTSFVMAYVRKAYHEKRAADKKRAVRPSGVGA